MAYLTIEDEEGSMEAIAFTDIFTETVSDFLRKTLL